MWRNQTAIFSGGLLPASHNPHKEAIRISKLFRDTPHLENSKLVLQSLAKTLRIDYLQVPDPKGLLASGATQVTHSAPARGQPPRSSSTLNMSAIVSIFLSSFQSMFPKSI